MAEDTHARNDEISNEEIIRNFKEIKEGKATILFPEGNTVFYNNVQVFNRDLSIAVIKVFSQLLCEEKTEKKQKHNICQINEDIVDSKSVSEKESSKKKNEAENSNTSYTKNEFAINILEALSATGLRAVRYALEIPDVFIVANDLSTSAVANIERNINFNNVKDKVKSSHADASLLMYEHRFPASRRFQVIDLDPYGSPCQFLDAAVQSSDDGGLLCVTCTDMGGLCGNHGEAGFAKYGAMPLKVKYCHEMALRIVLGCIDTHAGRYKRYIQPLIALSADFYIRVFVRIYTSASEVKRSASKKSYVFHCSGCETFNLQPVGKSIEVGDSKKYNPATGPCVGKECEHCGSNFKIGGPIWSNPMHDRSFITKLLESIKKEKECYATFDRINGVLSVMLEELEDKPLYLVLDSLCNTLHCTTPSQVQFRSALIHQGYKVSSTHANESGFKTNAPNSAIWDILRSWVKLHPVSKKKLKPRSPATAILKKEVDKEANFEPAEGAVPLSKKMKLSRFPANPETDWGPKARAKQGGHYSSLSEKRKQLQGKRQHPNNQPDYKKFACKKLKRGECDLGEKCKYSHDQGETAVEKDEEEQEEESPKEEVMET